MDEIVKVFLYNKFKEDRFFFVVKILFIEGKEDLREVSKVYICNLVNEKVYYCSLVFVLVLMFNNL